MVALLRALTVCFAVAACLAVAMPGASFAAEGAPAGPPPSVRIRPLMIPVLTPKGEVERYSQVEVTLEVPNSLKLPEVQAVVPKLHDAILTEMYHCIEEGYIIRGAVANAPAVRRNLLEAVAKVLGKDVVNRILITPTSRQSQWP
jgi:flagellar protein FliL